MTVAEMILELQSFDGHLPVKWSDSYGLTEIDSVYLDNEGSIDNIVVVMTSRTITEPIPGT